MVDVTSTTHHDHPGNPLSQQGKTTLFNMMSGNDEVGGPTHGLIKLFGENGWATGFGSIRHKTGIVPQFDCLLDHATGREHLRVYARMAGLYYPSKSGTRTEKESDSEPLLGRVGSSSDDLVGEKRIDAFYAVTKSNSPHGTAP